MHPLLSQLDLDNPSLADIAAHAERRDVSAALHGVATYFRNRVEPDPQMVAKANPNAVNAAEKALRREHTFYNEDGTLPAGDPDWTYKPGTDWEWTWALNRHFFWNSLSAAYLATKDERYARELDVNVRTWVAGHPANTDDLSAWRSLEAGIRVGGSWPGAMGAMKVSESFTDQAWLLFLRSISEHAEYLIANKRSNNWLLKEANGLLGCGLNFPEFRRASEWVRIAIERLEGEVRAQVHPDGAHVEYSSGYHFFSYHSLSTALERWDRVMATDYREFFPDDLPKFSDLYRERMELMWEHAMYLIRPDGQFPQLNDGEARNYSGQLAAMGKQYDRPDFIYAATNGAEGTPPADTSHRYPWVKRAVMRSGWDKDAMYALLETAPLGAGHVHEDALTFEIHAYGRPLIGTMGRFTYEHVPRRKFLTNSEGHNVVLIDGQGQNLRSSDPDRSGWIATEPTTDPWISTPELDVAEGEFAGPWTEGLEGLNWKRRMAFHKPDESVGRPGFWVVKDSFDGAGEHELRFLLHFLPGEIKWDDATGTIVSEFEGDGGNVIVTFADPDDMNFDCARGQDDPPRGWYSPEYGKIEPAWEVAAVRKAVFPAEFVMVMVPFRAKNTPNVAVQKTPAGMEVTIDGKTWPVEICRHAVLSARRSVGTPFCRSSIT